MISPREKLELFFIEIRIDILRHFRAICVLVNCIREKVNVVWSGIPFVVPFESSRTSVDINGSESFSKKLRITLIRKNCTEVLDLKTFISPSIDETPIETSLWTISNDGVWV